MALSIFRPRPGSPPRVRIPPRPRPRLQPHTRQFAWGRPNSEPISPSTRNPSRSMPGKHPRRNPSAGMIADFQALLAVARRQTGEIGGVPASDWWVSLVMVAWESGERIGALMAATPRDLRGQHLSIPAEARKGGAGRGRSTRSRRRRSPPSRQSSFLGAIGSGSGRFIAPPCGPG